MSAAYLALYEAIGGASRRMLVAARAAEWDALVAAESECAALVARARQEAPAKLDPASARRRHEIVRGILADDAEIRRRTEPRIAELEALISGAARGRLAARDYGA